MKKLGIVAALLLALHLNAHAADGKMMITGVVTDSTCSIKDGIVNRTAVLPTISAKSLATEGATGGMSAPADLRFTLTGCTGKATKVVAHFEMGSTVDETTGNLRNQAGTGAAEHVQVQLLNSAMKPINVSTNGNNTVAVNGADIRNGSAVLTYYARYYATGAATAGTVSTSVEYTMEYQ